MYTHGQETVLETAVVSLDTDADVAVFAVPFKAFVKRAFVLVTTTMVGTDAEVRFDVTPSGGSRSDGTAGIIKIPVNAAAGKYIYDLGGGSKLATVKEGDIITMKVIDGDASVGDGHVGLILERIPEDPRNNGNMILTA